MQLDSDGGVEDRRTEAFQVHDLLTGWRYMWAGSRAQVELSPNVVSAHILRVPRRVVTYRDFEYFL